MKKRVFSRVNVVLLLISAAAVALFLILNYGLESPEKLNADLQVSSWVQSVQSPSLVAMAKGIAVLFDMPSLLIAALAIAAILWVRRARNEAVLFVLVMLFNSAAVEAAKTIVQRARPLYSLVPENSYAFPSGHAATAIVFFGLLIWLSVKYLKTQKKYLATTLCSLMIPLIGFSRIYLNVHWLTDVIAGFALGAFVLCSSILIYRILEKNKK